MQILSFFYNLNTYKRSESETLNKYSTIIIDSVGTCFGFALLNVHKYGHTTYFPPSKYYCAVSDVKFRGQLILFVCLQWSVGLPVNQTEEISVYSMSLHWKVLFPPNCDATQTVTLFRGIFIFQFIVNLTIRGNVCRKGGLYI